ncbi:hypothetical protein Mgra_00006054 [Meloidogyne graminicola]|uniref:Uncharacterized protein n=1 Tax=Meloidogyne graminicola TaxID=189291 RepID=A0A8S9ZMJ8_9BILA|nr:hypothetical protein Mgra_00006054 [Meloidogyne graminicola]
MRTFICDILCYHFLVLQFFWSQSTKAEVLCTGLTNGRRQAHYCPVACCIRQETSLYNYYCCGTEEGPGPGWIRSDGRSNRYVTYNSVKIDWWNSLLISIAFSIIISVLLSLLCCFICIRRRR